MGHRRLRKRGKVEVVPAGKLTLLALMKANSTRLFLSVVFWGLMGLLASLSHKHLKKLRRHFTAPPGNPIGDFSGLIVGFPDGSDGKESVCNEGDLGIIPGLGRFPGEWNGNSLQYSCLENSMDRGA